MEDYIKEAINDYYADLKAQVSSEDYQGDDNDQALAKICISEGILDGEGEFEHAHYKGVVDIGQNPEIRVDAYCPEELSSKGILKVMVADCRMDMNDPEPIPLGSVYMAFINHARDFIKHCTDNSGFPEQIFRGNEEASVLASRIQEAWEEEKIEEIRIILVSTGILNNEESELDGVEHSAIEDVPVTYRVVDISRLSDLALTGVDVNLDLRGRFNDSIKAVRVDTVEDKTHIYTSYVGYIGGELLYNIYKKWTNRILEGNVRTFLEFGGSKSTNSGIKETLIKQPEKFFAYNNGLTCTAQDIQYDEETGEITALKNLQIVNGAQTTGSIYNAKLEEKDSVDLSKVRVQMKITEIQTLDRLFLQNVSRYSNTQNKLNVSDFDTNLPYHEALEILSHTVTFQSSKGWYYERARGSYKQQQMNRFRTGGSRARNEFTAKFPKKITKDDIAKTIQAFNGRPWMVCKGASENFKEFSENLKNYWDHRDSIYFELSNSGGETIRHFMCDSTANDHTEINESYFKEIVAKQIIFNELGNEISKHMEGWYNQQRGIRAALIAYSIAYLNHRLMEYGQCINFDIVWNEQSVPRPLMAMLLELAESMATYNDPLYIESMEAGKNMVTWNALVEGEHAAHKWSSLKELADTGVGPYLQSIEDYNRTRQQAKNFARNNYRQRINETLNSMNGRGLLWSRVKGWIDRTPESERPYVNEALLNKAAVPGILLDMEESIDLYQMYKEMIEAGMSNSRIELDDLVLHYGEDIQRF